jgi:hypothetical protein
MAFCPFDGKLHPDWKASAVFGERIIVMPNSDECVITFPVGGCHDKAYRAVFDALASFSCDTVGTCCGFRIP